MVGFLETLSEILILLFPSLFLIDRDLSLFSLFIEILSFLGVLWLDLIEFVEFLLLS